jgi:hypothetical protein
MLIKNFLSNLPYSLGDNPWRKDSINKNFITRFHRQCDYLLGFQVSRKISDSILEKKWPYETPALAYNREMDQLVVANTIENEVEKENIPRLGDEKSEGQKQHT